MTYYHVSVYAAPDFSGAAYTVCSTVLLFYKLSYKLCQGKEQTSFSATLSRDGNIKSLIQIAKWKIYISQSCDTSAKPKKFEVWRGNDLTGMDVLFSVSFLHHYND